MDTNPELNTALADRYQIDRAIGRGGMATVYLARDLRHDRRVALKVVHPELGALLGAERFVSEIRVMASLQHPNLLPLFDSGEAAGQLFYVMPFVDGETLRTRLEREKQLPVDTAVRIATEIASALDYAHRHGVVHRDLKPENILLSEGHPLVADFGIALALTHAGGQRITQTGLSLGTPQYMSPEQATGDRVIDARSDIYSLGAVLYEMLAGEPPHTGSSAQAVIARVITDKPRSLQLCRDTVPPHVVAAVERALAKLPADRFATAAEFAAALGAPGWMANASAVWAPGQWTTGEGARRSRVGVGALIGGVALAALLGAAGMWAWAARTASMDQATVALVVEPPPGVRITPNASTFDITPDGRTIVFTGSSDSATRLYVRKLSEVDAHALEGTEGANFPVFSPDGRWILFTGSRAQLRKIPVEGGAVLPVAEKGGIPFAAWGSNDMIVLPTTRTEFRRVAASGGEPQPFIIPKSRDQYLLAPVMAIDGKRFLFGTSGPNADETDDTIGVGSFDDPAYRKSDVPGGAPLGMVGDYLVYLRDRAPAAFAVRFDPATARSRGKPSLVFTAQGSTLNARVNASGSLLYVRGANSTRLALVNAGGLESPLIPTPLWYGSPRISPDGRTVLYTIDSPDIPGRGEVWSYDIARQTNTRLVAASPSANNVRPEWLADGRTFTFLVARRGVRVVDTEVWSMKADGSENPVRLDIKLPDGASLQELVPVPLAGGFLVRTVSAESRGDIWYIPPGGATPVPFVATQYPERMPRLSPDGRWVAYSANEGGFFQVYVKPFPGPGPRVAISNGAGAEPVWDPRGGRLVYSNGRELVAARYSVTGGSFTVTAREPLPIRGIEQATQSAGFDITPSGEILVRRPATDPQLVLISNWGRDLRQKMEASGRP